MVAISLTVFEGGPTEVVPLSFLFGCDSTALSRGWARQAMRIAAKIRVAEHDLRLCIKHPPDKVPDHSIAWFQQNRRGFPHTFFENRIYQIKINSKRILH